jgi:hypothetical protein
MLQDPFFAHFDLVLAPHLRPNILWQLASCMRSDSARLMLRCAHKNLTLNMSRREGLSPWNTIQRAVFSLTIRCGNCGAENRNEANYCLRCGQSIVIPPLRGSAIGQPANQPTSWKPFPFRGCYLHPTLPATFNCSSCRAPVCSVCARFYYGDVYCPICYSRRVGTWAPKVRSPSWNPFAQKYARSA